MYRINHILSLRIGILLMSILSLTSLFGQKEIVTISGFAPDYVGKEISFSQIEDYYSNVQSKLATTVVKADSSFSVQFYSDKTRKIVVNALNNFGWMYIEPNAKYEIFVPNRNPRDPYVKTGNQIEVSFFDLKPEDINYKILSFQRWTDEYMARYYPLKFSDPVQFAQRLDTFKTYVERAYKNDSSIYFMTYVKFSIAELDEIQFMGSRNKYEKFDFYIKNSPVFYENDAYMEYVKKYYKNMIPRLSNEANNAVYLGVLKSSPTLIMKALGSDYALQNLRIREMVMIQALSEVYFGDDFPQTNINTIFDSLKRRCLFEENQMIAKNVFYRLNDLVPGGKAPNFVLFKEDESSKTHLDYRGKHLYITFYDPKSPNNQKEMVLLKEMHRKYINDVQFLTIILNDEELTEAEKADVASIQWDKFYRGSKDDFLEKFHISNFPSYVLIDAMGYIVDAPALGPTPNAQYQTIDKVFYYIQKANRERLENGER